MQISTALNRLRDARESLASILSLAEISGLSHDWIVAQIKERIWGAPYWAKLPRWASSEFHGWMSAKFQGLYQGPQPRVVWRHIWEGKAYDGWNDCPEECRQAMRENRGDSAHLWARHLPAIKRFSGASETVAHKEAAV